MSNKCIDTLIVPSRPRKTIITYYLRLLPLVGGSKHERMLKNGLMARKAKFLILGSRDGEGPGYSFV